MSTVDWTVFNLVPKPLRGADRLVEEMTAHVGAGGDPNPSVDLSTADGYKLGKYLGNARRGNLAMTDEHWAALDVLGVQRRFNHGVHRLIVEMTNHVMAGGDPNPSKTCRTPDGYNLGRILGDARRGTIETTDEDWVTLKALGTKRNPSPGADRLIKEMTAHVQAGGDPNPPQSYRSPNGYGLGLALSGARAETNITTTDEHWAILETLGVHREAPRKPWGSAAARLMHEIRQHIEEGGIPNPPSQQRTASGYCLGWTLSEARHGRIALTDAQWQELEAIGVSRTKPPLGRPPRQ